MCINIITALLSVYVPPNMYVKQQRVLLHVALGVHFYVCVCMLVWVWVSVYAFVGVGFCVWVCVCLLVSECVWVWVYKPNGNQGHVLFGVSEL